MADIKLLDCTLRDGGYVNNWQWGFGSARRIIQTLTRAGVDIVEVGFLRNVDGYDPDVTVCNTIEELNRLLPDEGQRGHTMYSGMAMRSNYDIAKLSPYDGHGIEIIRITAHDYDIKDGMDFARRIKNWATRSPSTPSTSWATATRTCSGSLSRSTKFIRGSSPLWIPSAVCAAAIWSASSAWLTII